MKTSYSERDYSFGQAMLALRSAIGLTQAGLAKYLGVSRQAVGEWEGGSSYPKEEHLQQVITLGLAQGAFADGHEAREIRQLWKMAHQRVLLDEHWLSVLLSQRPSRHLHLVPSPLSNASSTPVLDHPPSEPLAPAATPRVDWGDALAVSAFYGREEEQTQLIQWIEQERCRMVSVLGMGAIGKSALAVNIMYQVASHFEVVIFRSLRNAPSCEALLDECLQVLSPEPITSMPAGQAQGTVPTEQRINLFLKYLREIRALVVFDNLEILLQEGDVRGQLRPGFEGYGSLLRQVGETAHQSCLLLTSREKLAILRPLESRSSLVRSLRLAALDTTACMQLLKEGELAGTQQEQESLIEVYSGNPLALKIVRETIFDLFGGEIGPFLAGGTGIFGNVTVLLDEQFARLSAQEQSVLCWLAIMREPVTLDELQASQVNPPPHIQLLETVDAGYRRSLIERGQRSGSFTLQSVVLEYVTALLIVEGSREIQQGQLRRLLSFSNPQRHFLYL